MAWKSLLKPLDVGRDIVAPKPKRAFRGHKYIPLFYHHIHTKPFWMPYVKRDMFYTNTFIMGWLLFFPLASSSFFPLDSVLNCLLPTFFIFKHISLVLQIYVSCHIPSLDASMTKYKAQNGPLLKLLSFWKELQLYCTNTTINSCIKIPFLIGISHSSTF